MSDDRPTIADAEKRQVPCGVYSRIVGYLTRVEDWNRGKQSEFVERKVYRVPEGEEC